MKLGSLLFCAIVCLFLGWISLTPGGIEFYNTYLKSLKKADLNSNFESAKKAEDTARAMMASYNMDKANYESLKTISNPAPIDLEEIKNYKIRLNQTAATYNEFMLKNSFVWKDNIPSDIKQKLDFVQ